MAAIKNGCRLFAFSNIKNLKFERGHFNVETRKSQHQN